MKKIFTLFAALAMVMSMSAKTIYLNTGGSGLWNQGGAKFGCHTWGSSEKSGWMTHVEGDIYSFETLDANTNVIFTRVQSSATGIWDKEWNRIETTIPADKNYCSITGWDASDYAWSTYITHTFAKGTTLYIDFRAITTEKKGANYPKANAAGLDYSGTAGGTIIPITFTADVKWAEGAEFMKTDQGGWASIPFKAPSEGANCAQVAADGKSYTWTTFSEPTVTLSLDKTEADAGTEVTVTLTATADNVTGDVTYAFQYSTDEATWNDMEATGNTATQTFAAETRYYKVTMTNGGTTKEATAKFTGIKFHVIGSWDNWATHHEIVDGSKTITLEADSTYEYKITAGNWDIHWGNNGTMTRDNCTGWSFDADSNAKITADLTGEYVFNVVRNAEGKVVVSVTYPELPAPHVTLHKVLVGEDLQAVVSQALSSDTVLVQAGTYEGNFTMKDGVYVSGGWNADFTEQTQHASILDAKASGRVLNQPTAFDALTIWDNFTIQNGKLTEVLTDKLGAGVALLKNGRVINCLVQNNTFTYDPATQCAGGGIAQNSNGDTCAINCIVRNNKATHGGGIRTAGVAINCLVENNEATGNGGGVYLHNIGQLHNSIVRNNVCKKDVGGIDIAGVGGAVYNCLVVGNHADGNIGGVQARKYNDVINTTIVGNNHNTTTADRVTWAGFRASDNTNTNYNGKLFVNNVIWGNTHNDTLVNQVMPYLKHYATNGKFVNNALQGSSDALDTISTVTYIHLSAENDPQFNEDYSFATTSPLYNAGTNDALTYFVGDKDVYGNARKQGANIEIGAVEIAEPTQTIITETFDLTQEDDTRNMGGAYAIYAGDYTLRIYGYTGAGTYQDDPATEEDAAPMLFTPDYDDALNAVVVVTIDEENNKEVMQVTATSADGLKVYNLTINIALPSYEKYSLIATGIQAENDEVEGMPVIRLKGEGLLNGEATMPFDFMVYETMMGYMAEGSIGDIYAYSTEAIFFVEEGAFTFMATMQDDEGKYLFNVEMYGTMAQEEVEINITETIDLTAYKLTIEAQGNMATVSAFVEEKEIFFWLDLNQGEEGVYPAAAASNIWYGDDQLQPAANTFIVYSEEEDVKELLASFISTPDAEGNAIMYNFTLISGEKPANPTGLDNINATVAPVKMIENGQIFIISNGVKFNAQGAIVK